MPEIRNKKGEKNYNDIKKSPKLEILQNRCFDLLRQIQGYTCCWSLDSRLGFKDLYYKYNSLLNNKNNLRIWQDFMDTIVKSICKDIGYPSFIEYMLSYQSPDINLIDYFKHKVKGKEYYYFHGIDKLEERISKEQKQSKENVVIDKVVQNKLSQKD